MDSPIRTGFSDIAVDAAQILLTPEAIGALIFTWCVTHGLKEMLCASGFKITKKARLWIVRTASIVVGFFAAMYVYRHVQQHEYWLGFSALLAVANTYAYKALFAVIDTVFPNFAKNLKPHRRKE